MLYPVLIGLGCLVLVVTVHLLTRPKPSRRDIKLPATPEPATTAPRPGLALADWHRAHEATVLSFLDRFDGHGVVILRDDGGDELIEEFERAMDAHPAPDMRAELAALRTAAEAMTLARERHDNDAVERHQRVYSTYRSAWLERLWQYPVDRARVVATRERAVEVPPSD